jgi:hypothetical protein
MTGNMILFGEPGSGKSTFLKCSILGNFTNQRIDQTLVVDFEKEYTNLAQNFDQTILYFTRDPKEDSPHVNICELPKEIDVAGMSEEDKKKIDFTTPRQRFTDGCSYLETLLKMILMESGEKPTSLMINVLQVEIRRMYEKFGITALKEFSHIPSNKWPTIDDLKICVDEKLGKLEKQKNTAYEKESYALISRFLTP